MANYNTQDILGTIEDGTSTATLVNQLRQAAVNSRRDAIDLLDGFVEQEGSGESVTTEDFCLVNQSGQILNSMSMQRFRFIDPMVKIMTPALSQKPITLRLSELVAKRDASLNFMLTAAVPSKEAFLCDDVQWSAYVSTMTEPAQTSFQWIEIGGISTPTFDVVQDILMQTCLTEGFQLSGSTVSYESAIRDVALSAYKSAFLVDLCDAATSGDSDVTFSNVVEDFLRREGQDDDIAQEAVRDWSLLFTGREKMNSPELLLEKLSLSYQIAKFEGRFDKMELGEVQTVGAAFSWAVCKTVASSIADMALGILTMVGRFIHPAVAIGAGIAMLAKQAFGMLKAQLSVGGANTDFGLKSNNPYDAVDVPFASYTSPRVSGSFDFKTQKCTCVNHIVRHAIEKGFLVLDFGFFYLTGSVHDLVVESEDPVAGIVKFTAAAKITMFIKPQQRGFQHHAVQGVRTEKYASAYEKPDGLFYTLNDDPQSAKELLATGYTFQPIVIVYGDGGIPSTVPTTVMWANGNGSADEVLRDTSLFDADAEEVKQAIGESILKVWFTYLIWQNQRLRPNIEQVSVFGDVDNMSPAPFFVSSKSCGLLREKVVFGDHALRAAKYLGSPSALDGMGGHTMPLNRLLLRAMGVKEIPSANVPHPVERLSTKEFLENVWYNPVFSTAAGDMCRRAFTLLSNMPKEDFDAFPAMWYGAAYSQSWDFKCRWSVPAWSEYVALHTAQTCALVLVTTAAVATVVASKIKSKARYKSNVLQAQLNSARVAYANGTLTEKELNQAYDRNRKFDRLCSALNLTGSTTTSLAVGGIGEAVSTFGDKFSSSVDSLSENVSEKLTAIQDILDGDGDGDAELTDAEKLDAIYNVVAKDLSRVRPQLLGF